MPEQMEKWNQRTELLLGAEGVDRLASSHVLVVGTGGVGAYAVEMIARAGVGRITLVDGDEVGVTNLNRQLPALHSTLGKLKVDVMAERIRDIHPEAQAIALPKFITADDAASLFDGANYDFVIDAIDAVAPKVALIEHCLLNKIPIISSMGAGGDAYRRNCQQEVELRDGGLSARRVWLYAGCSCNQKTVAKMIEIKGINKSYGSLQVLRDVNATIGNGEIVSIVGPSGAGKTTLLQIAGTLDTPDSGRVIYDGVDVLSLSEKKLSAFRNSHIGFVFQFHQLLPEFTALENVAIPALIKGDRAADAYKRAAELIDYMGLSGRADHKPAALSGGEKQRIAVARALMNRPSVIFADEPSGSLDSRNKEELHKLFFDLRREFSQTFVIVTHDESLAMMCDRVLTMHDGVIVSDMKKDKIDE